MVHIDPVISFTRALIRHMEEGRSLVSSIKMTHNEEQTPFSTKVYLWLHYHHQKQKDGPWNPSSHFQMGLQQILHEGLEGAPVYETLKQIQEEMEMEFEHQWKKHLETLPVRLSIPLLLFFFPAYLLMLFGPLLTQFIKEIQ